MKLQVLLEHCAFTTDVLAQCVVVLFLFPSFSSREVDNYDVTCMQQTDMIFFINKFFKNAVLLLYETRAS